MRMYMDPRVDPNIAVQWPRRGPNPKLQISMLTKQQQMMFDLSPAAACYLGAAILDTVRRAVGTAVADDLWNEAVRRATAGRADYTPRARTALPQVPWKER